MKAICQAKTLTILFTVSVLAVGLLVWCTPDQFRSRSKYAVITLARWINGSKETTAGWTKSQANPVLGDSLGSCFAVSILAEDVYRMWFSWRSQDSIALVQSADGIEWGSPTIVLAPNPSSGWEDTVNRPSVIRRPDGYHMWYTGQTRDRSNIGYAVSTNGTSFVRVTSDPVLVPTTPWEKAAVMSPHVLWDEYAQIYRMWYSAGDQYEPDAIGYATSADGRLWSKNPVPIFLPSPGNQWDSYKVAGAQIIPFEGWYLMFYIGFRDIHHARIGLARSRDGISGWQRHPANPIISEGMGFDRWDRDAVYKPFAILDDERWLLWYNGRRDLLEQIGVVEHPGTDLGFGNAE